MTKLIRTTLTGALVSRLPELAPHLRQATGAPLWKQS